VPDGHESGHVQGRSDGGAAALDVSAATVFA